MVNKLSGRTCGRTTDGQPENIMSPERSGGGGIQEAQLPHR